MDPTPHRLKRTVGPFALLMIAIGGMIGSGWLFAAMYAAQQAGPAAIIAWGIGGIMALCIALIYAELGGMLPVAGGLARYPHFSHGTTVSYLAGWLCWLGYVAVAPIEVIGTLEYLNNEFPFLAEKGDGEMILSPSGTAIAIGLLAVFTIVNYFGVKIMTDSNKVITVWKLIIPLITIITLVATGFNAENFTVQGFMPFGWSGVLAAVSGGGVVFSLLGFRAAVELAAEAKRPRLSVPFALIGSVLFCIILYAGLEVAFVGALPEGSLAEGWGQIATHSASGPFAAVAMALGMAWLAMLLYVDAVVSPFGTALLFTGGSARLSYAMSRNNNVPAALGRVSRWGVPGWSLVFNVIVGVAMLLPVPGWAALVGILTSATVLAAGFGIVAAATGRIQLPDLPRHYKVPMLSVVAPITFIFCNLIVYWSGFKSVMVLSILLIVGLGLMPLGLRRAESMGQKMHMANAAWAGPYLGGLFCISWLGQFGGSQMIPTGWDHLILGLFSLVIFYWATASALSPQECRELVESADDRMVVEPT